MMSRASGPSSCGGGSPCGSVGGASGMSDSRQDTPPRNQTRPLPRPSMETGSSGSGSESHGNGSHGYASVGKDSAHSSSNRRVEREAEVLRVIRALRLQVAPHSRDKSSNTLHTLRYALRCVQHVSAKEQFYQTLHLGGVVAVAPAVGVAYTSQQIHDITAEHTRKNADVFVVCVSLQSGVVMCVSEQVCVVLQCQQEVFQGSKFTSLLMPQDVPVYYRHTDPHRLPPYDGSSTVLTQDKSFFCRISSKNPS